MRFPLLATFVLFSATCGVIFSFTACSPATGGGVTSEGYSAPAPVSPVQATENMRSQYRKFR